MKKRLNGKVLIVFLACAVMLHTSAVVCNDLGQEASHERIVEEIYSCCKATQPHIIVTPDKLCELRLNELFRLVLEHACATNTLQELPPGLLACFDRLEHGAQTVHVQDLAQALPVLIEKLTSIISAESEKASRPDAPGNTDGSPVGTLLGCDCNEILSLLNRLKQIGIQCCNILEQDFFFTWTILADIKATLTTCCAELEADFDGTFTVLNDINNTLTTCCATLENDFVGTFTSLTDIKDTLTACCAAIEVNFEGTFTTLIDIENTLTTCCANIRSGCIITPITQALIDAAGGAFTIIDPGNYTLSENILSDAPTIITIAANEVTLDLCGRTIAGFSNGTTANIGILVNPNLSSIVIKNGHIDPLTNAGIVVSSGAFNITISDIQVTDCDLAGIQFAGTGLDPIRESYIINCQVSSCATNTGGVGGLVLENCDTVIVQGGTFNRNGSANSTVSVAGIFLNTCTNCTVSGASMNENTGIQVFGLEIFNGANNTITSCIANSNAGVATLGTSTCLGFVAISGLENGFVNCTALMNTGSVAYGFGLVGLESLSSVVGCRAESNEGSLPFEELNDINGAGVIVDGAGGASFNEVQNNVVVRNNQSGIFDSSISFTISAGTAFVVTGASTTLVSGNSAVDNGLSGPPFDTTTPFSNYTVAYPVGQPVEFISFRYSVGGSPVVSPAGNTMIANIDTRFS